MLFYISVDISVFLGVLFQMPTGHHLLKCSAVVIFLALRLIVVQGFYQLFI